MNWIALVAIIVSIVVLYFVGTIITSPFVDDSKDSFYDTFVRLVVGFLVVTTIYAIVKTGGNTVQFGLLLLGAFYIVSKALKKDIRKPVFNISIVGISTACAVGLLFFVYYALFYYNTPINNILHNDYYVYAFNSYSNQLSGIETTGVYLDGMLKVSPYHYIEGWFCALIANTFCINYLETFSICVQCILSSIVVLGLISLAKIYTSKLVLIIFACTTISLSAVLLDYAPIRQSMAMGGNIKDCIAAMFIIAFMISIMKGNTNYLWLLCLPIANAALSPIIMSTLFIFAFVLYKLDKNKSKLIYNLVEIFVIGIFLVLFYVLRQNDFPHVNTSASFVPVLISSYTLVDFLHIAYRTIVNYAMYVPYFIPLIFLFVIKRNLIGEFFLSHSKQLIFIVISAICGLICHYLYYPINKVDSDQLDTLVNMTLMNLIVLISFLFVCQKLENKISKCIFYIFIVIVSAYNVWIFTESIVSRRRILANEVDVDYRNNIMSYFSNNKISHIGARLLPSDLLGSVYMNACDIYQMGFLGGSLDGLAAICISPLSMLEEQSSCTSVFPPNNIFNNYLSQFDTSYDLDSIQVDFITRYDLGYIIVHKHAELPNAICPLVDTVYTDNITGEGFVILKK